MTHSLWVTSPTFSLADRPGSLDQRPWRYGPVAELLNFKKNFPFGRELFSACLWDSLQDHHMIHLKYLLFKPLEKTVFVCPWIPGWSSPGISIRSGLIPSLSKDFLTFASAIFVLLISVTLASIRYPYSRDSKNWQVDSNRKEQSKCFWNSNQLCWAPNISQGFSLRIFEFGAVSCQFSAIYSKTTTKYYRRKVWSIPKYLCSSGQHCEFQKILYLHKYWFRYQ